MWLAAGMFVVPIVPSMVATIAACTCEWSISMFILGISSDCLDPTLRLKMLLHSVVDHVLQVLVKLFFVANELLHNRDFVGRRIGS
jgi:hypothetical protein